MSKLLYIVIIFVTLLSSCSSLRNTANSGDKLDVRLDTFRLYDESRQREIPIATYKSKSSFQNGEVIIFSHGYGANYPKNYLVYSYVTSYLASEGYFVVSIQHELPNDSLLPFTGNPQLVRLPFWERGVENIYYTINELKKIDPTLDFEHITLIGHSNGGDMAALFPQKHPNIVERIITLDQLRVPLPRTTELKVYSLRSSDKQADEGVLPTADEQKQFGITVIKLLNIEHNDMNDFGKNKKKRVIKRYVLEFMEN
jgi:pimeloyl-ACP methyl ester carboxylesterase